MIFNYSSVTRPLILLCRGIIADHIRDYDATLTYAIVINAVKVAVEVY